MRFSAGSLITSIDAAGHQTTLSYDDSFSDNTNHNTFAYPTVVKDPDWNASTAATNYSTVQYNYDFGAQTRVQGPPPAGQSQGAIQTFSYDSTRRLQQVITTNNNSYKRFFYGANYVQSFATVNTSNDEAYAIQIFDGLGRRIAAGGNHPGSSGGYRGELTFSAALIENRKIGGLTPIGKALKSIIRDRLSARREDMPVRRCSFASECCIRRAVYWAQRSLRN